MKLKTVFQCQNCGFTSPKWVGQFPDCQQWNTMAEEVVDTAPAGKSAKALTDFSSELTKLSDSAGHDEIRIGTEIAELDRLFGGGLVKGQIVLLAGMPGIGKSTLMLQIAGNLAKKGKVLYVTGEESLNQVGARAKRLNIKNDNIYLLAETNLQKIIEAFKKVKPEVMIVDSVQTVYHPEFTGSSGTVGQVRESAAELLRLCKPCGSVLFLLGHVTKEGSLAGPKVLEHIVDTVLYFDSERYNVLRILRAHKNRFGPTSEIGIFQMHENGLNAVDDASTFFSAAARNKALAGRAFSVALEGTRPMLAEVQALVTPTRYPFPRRMVSGADLNRCQILFAALEKHLNLNLENKDIFVSIAGGIKLNDPALDLAVCAAVTSSLKEFAVPSDSVFIGEVGILGQLSRVSLLDMRIGEAQRLGFKTVFAPPLSSGEKIRSKSIEVKIIEEIHEVLNHIKVKS